MNGTLHIQSIYCYYQNAPFNRVTLMNAGLFDLEMTYDIVFIRVFNGKHIFCFDYFSSLVLTTSKFL